MYTVTAIFRYTKNRLVHGEYETKEEAYKAARALSKDAAISTTSVKTGIGYELRNIGTWCAGKKVI